MLALEARVISLTYHDPIALTYFMFRSLRVSHSISSMIYLMSDRGPRTGPHVPVRRGSGGSLPTATGWFTPHGDRIEWTTPDDTCYNRRSIDRCLFACARAMILFDRFCPAVSGVGSFFTNGPYLRVNMCSRIFLGLI